MRHITWDFLLGKYTEHIRAAGHSARTIRHRRYQLARLTKIAPTPERLTAKMLIEYANDHQWEPETRRSFFSSARTLYAWANKAGYLDCDPTALLPAVKVPQTLGQPPSDIVILQSIRSATPRERLMLRVASVLGLRVCEIAVIHERDWDGRELVVHGKGSKDRLLMVKDPVLQYAFNNMEGYLFKGRIDGHLSPDTVSKLVSRCLPSGVTAHKLRHRFATQAYRQNEDILSVAIALGHSKISTTQRYVGPSRRRLEATMEGALLSAA